MIFSQYLILQPEGFLATFPFPCFPAQRAVPQPTGAKKQPISVKFSSEEQDYPGLNKFHYPTILSFIVLLTISVSEATCSLL